MKFLKSAFAALVLAATTCCAPAAKTVLGPPTREDAATLLRSRTVGLVSDDSLEEPAAYCSAVWVSQTSILTAYHCMDDGEVGTPIWYVVDNDVFPKGSIVVRPKIEKRAAVLYDVDKKHDLAILRAGKAPDDHGIASLATTAARAGQFVQVMGQPAGFLWWSYSSGDVAAVRTLDAGGYFDPNTVFIQTTAPTSPGSSGGGLFDADGDLLGVCHGGFRKGQNLNIFIGTPHLKAFLDAQGTAL